MLSVYNNLESLKKQIDLHDVVSFDIFDTLILRPYFFPENLFSYIEYKYCIKDFYNLRMSAQSRAYQNLSYGREDSNLNEIYRYYANISNSQDIEEIKSIEINEEINQSFRNDEMYEIYQYAINSGKKVIFVSDMYLPEAVIKQILEKNGYQVLENNLFVSSKYSKLKRTGTLFNIVLNELNVKTNKIIHIGDNPYSDYESPRKLGITAYNYIKKQDAYIDPFKNNKFKLEALNNALKDCAISQSVMCQLLHSDKLEKFNYWERFGYEYAGPILYNYVKWIVEKAKLYNIEDVIFIARDGYVLEKIFKKFNLENIRTHYIYAPRSLNLFCQLNYDKNSSFTFEHTKTIVDYYRTKSDLINNLPEVTTAEIGVELIENNREEFERLASIEFENYCTYLKNQNITSNKILSVDSVSKFFSAQKLFERILDKKITGLYYLIQEGADLNNIDVHSYKDISLYSDDCLMVEFLMTSPEPPIENIDNGNVIYKEISEAERIRIETFNKIEAGILEFVDDILTLPSTSMIPAQSCYLTKFINTLIEFPSIKDKEEFNEIKFATDPKHENFKRLYENWYKTEKKLSVIVPVYNVEKYLSQCLDSIINSSYSNLEIICVNDGSTDRSIDILNEYSKKDNRIKIVNKQNGGLSSARNAGLKVHTGEYVTFLDSDDFVDANFYKLLIDRLEADDSDIAIGETHYYYDESNINPNEYVNTMNFSSNIQIISEIGDRLSIIRGCAVWNKIYKSSMIRENNLDFPEGLYIEDVPFTFATTILAKRLSLVRGSILYYRQQPESILAKARNNKVPFDIFKIYENCERFLKKSNLNKKTKRTYKKMLDYFEIVNIYGWFDKCGDNFKKDFYKLMKNKFRKINIRKNKYIDNFAKIVYFAVIRSNDCSKIKEIVESNKYTYSLMEKLFFYKRKQHSTGTTRVNILGLPVYKKKITDFKVRKYLFGIEVYKKKIDRYTTRRYILGLRYSKTFNMRGLIEDTKCEVEKVNLENQQIKKEVYNTNNKLNKLYKEVFNNRNLIIDEIHGLYNELYKEVFNNRNLILEQCNNINIKISDNNLLARINRLNQTNLSTASLHQKTFLPFKSIHEGQDIVLVACGPTAKYYIPKENVIHIGVNRAFLINNIDLQYLFMQDYNSNIKNHMNEANAYKPNTCKKFYGLTTEYDTENINRVIPEQETILANAYRYRTDWANLPYFEPKFAYDISTSPLGCFGSIVFPALQFAFWTNPRRIYLVGCDCSNAGYFDSNKANEELAPDNIKRAYGKLKHFASVYYPNTEIISINPVGLKGLFKDEYTKEYLEEIEAVAQNV